MPESISSLELADFDVSSERGFLPKHDPLTSLPGDWNFLDQFGQELPVVIKRGNVLETAQSLPNPTVAMLASLTELERNRAMMIYGFGVSAVIHSTKPSQTLLFKSLAWPLWWLSKQFGKPPILSYCSYALNNWARINSEKDIEVENLRLLQNFIKMPGVEMSDEDWFILIHVDIEKRAVPAIKATPDAILAAELKDVDALLLSLQNIGRALEEMIRTLKRMPEHCSTNVYYRLVRPWIMFFENVIYEGVDEFANTPQRFRGETGAQSSIMPLLEATLNIGHASSVLTQHLQEMRLYMPPKHRTFIEEIEKRSGVREFVINSGLKNLKDAYNYCLEKIFEFRDIHLGYAHSYIHEKTTDSRGTGGTIFMPWLDQMKQETAQMFLK